MEQNDKDTSHVPQKPQELFSSRVSSLLKTLRSRPKVLIIGAITVFLLSIGIIYVSSFLSLRSDFQVTQEKQTQLGLNPFVDSSYEVKNCIKEAIGEENFEEIVRNERRPTDEESKTVGMCAEKFGTRKEAAPATAALSCPEKPDVNVQSLVRLNQPILKGLLEPGTPELNKLLNEDAERIRALGVNTIYIYADYSYEDGKFVLSNTCQRFPKSTQAEIENGHITNIIKAKQAGFAVHLAIAYGSGHNTPFNVPLDRFLADAKKAALKWASIAEKYKVESFAPGSEIDWQIYREYYLPSDLHNNTKVRDGVLAANKFHNDILTEIRKVYTGKVIYQSGHVSPLTESKGYDVLGQGPNGIKKELSEWRQQVREAFAIAAANAKSMGSDWIITEFWVPIREQGSSAEPDTELFYTKSGVPYAEIQHEFYKIMFEEYLAWNGDIKPSGFGFTPYINMNGPVKDRPTEELVKKFYNQLGN